MLSRGRENNGLGCRDDSGKMVVVRERALMVREAAIGVRFGLVGSGNLNRSELRLVVQMQRREQLKADVPDKDEQQHEGALPPQKRQGLRKGSPVPSDLQPHAFHLCLRLSQLDAEGSIGLPGLGNRGSLLTSWLLDSRLLTS